MLFWITLFSVLMFIGSLVFAWLLVVRMPVDYLTRPQNANRNDRGTFVRALLFVCANLFGVGLLVSGLIMLVTPGQGLMFIFLGVAVMDFPGKRKVSSRLLGNQKVLKIINQIRRRAGKAPLEQAIVTDRH